MQLNKSNESRRKLSHDANFLREQLDEMASSVVQSKLRIGELEATNCFLLTRLRENSSKSSGERLRTLVRFP